MKAVREICYYKKALRNFFVMLFPCIHLFVSGFPPGLFFASKNKLLLNSSAFLFVFSGGYARNGFEFSAEIIDVGKAYF